MTSEEMKSFFNGLETTKKIISDNEDIFNSILKNENIWNDLNKLKDIQKCGYTVKNEYRQTIKCKKNEILDNKIAVLANPESDLVITEEDFNNIYYKLISDNDFNIYCLEGFNGNVAYNFDYIWFFKYYNKNYFIKGSDKYIYVTNEKISKQNLIRVINDKKNLGKKNEQNYQDYFINDIVGTEFRITNLIELIKIIGEYKNIKDNMLNKSYDIFIKKVNDLNLEYNNWINLQTKKSIFNKNPFINLSSDFFKIIKNKLFYVKNINTTLEINEKIKNDPSIFNNIKIDLVIDDEYKRDLISKINVNIQNFYNKNQINDGIQLKINIINYIKEDNTMNDMYMRFLNILVKLPHDLYLKINNIDNDKIKHLCNNFGNWLKICSNSPLVNIFKYSYYLLINKLFNIDQINEVKNYILEVKNYILEEFILDVDQYVLTDLQLISVIKEIKDKLSEVKIWYWDNDSFNVILEKISALIKNDDNNKLLTTGDLNYNFDFDSNIYVINFKYFEQGSDYVFSNPDKKTDNKVPPLLIENSALCFKFPNLEIINFDNTTDLNKVLILLQMINCLKLSVPFENNYPKELPFTKDIISLCFEQNLDNILYKANYEIKEKNILNAKKEITNEFNTIKYIENVEIPSVNFEYINNFINFIDSKNQDYLYSKINPFIKYGLELLEKNNFEPEKNKFEPVNYDNLTIIGEESFINKQFFKLKNNIYKLLELNNKNIVDIDLKLFNELDPIPANLYLFIYLYICEKSENSIKFIKNNKDIVKNKLKSFDSLQNLDETIQLMCLSNIIKIKVIEEVYDEEFYKSIEEILKNNEILQKVDNNIINVDIPDLNKSNKVIDIEGKPIEFDCIEYTIPFRNFVSKHSQGPFNEYKIYSDRNKSFNSLINTLIQNQHKTDKNTKKKEPALCYGLWAENNNYTDNETKFIKVMTTLFEQNYGDLSFNTVAKLIDQDWKIIPNILTINNDINNATIRYLIGSDTMDKLNINKDNFRPTVETANNINLEDYEKLPLNPNMKAYIHRLVNEIKNPSKSSISSTIPSAGAGSSSSTGRSAGASSSSSTIRPSGAGSSSSTIRPTGAGSSSSTSRSTGASSSSSRHILKIDPISNKKTDSSNSKEKIIIDKTGIKNFKIIRNNESPTSFIGKIRLAEELIINIDFSNDTMNLKRGNFTINETPIKDKVVINDLLSKIENKQIEVEEVQGGGKSKTRLSFDSDSDSDIIFDSDTDSFLDSDTDFSFDSDTDTDIILDKKFMKMKGGQEIKLTDYFYNQYTTKDNNNIKKIKTMLPCLKKTNNNQEKEYVYTYRNMIVHNLYYFISLLNKDIHYDSNFGQLYNFDNKFNSEVYEFNNIDDPIKKIYLSREINGFRNIFVSGKDMFQIYKSNKDLLNIYNKGPFIDTRENTRNKFSQKLQNIINKNIKLRKKILISGEKFVLNDIKEDEKEIFIDDKEQQKYLDMIKNNNYNNKLVNEGYNFNFNEKNIHITGNLDYIENLVFKGKYDCSTKEIIFETPVYLSNPIFYDSKYFKYVQINNKSNSDEIGEIIAIGDNKIYKNNKLKLIVTENTYSIVNKYGNTYVDISEIMGNDLYNKIIGMTKEKNCILCWKNNNNQIITVDIIDIKLNLIINYDNVNLSILYNNLYKIILDFDLVDWNVKKWVISDKILLTQENNNPNGKYYLILLREDSNILIELNQNTFLPVINDKKTLEYFINELVLNNNNNNNNNNGKILLKELVPLIVKFGIEYNNQSINDYVKKYMDNSIGSSIVYNIKYNYLEINDLLLIDKYYEKYYCPDNNRYFVSISEYMLYSLSSEEKIVYLEENELKEVVLRDLAFSIFYKKLISNHNKKWGDAPVQPYIFNPLELYYQYIFGSFASKEQLDLAEKIFQDSVQKKINCPVMEGGYKYRLSYYFNIQPNCYENFVENPKIYNLIMGSGKTKVITPLVILKYLQYLTTLPENDRKQNCYLILPENLVNQSFEHLKSYLDMYFPILVNKCFEKRGIQNNDFKTYLETLENNNDNEDIKSKTYLDVYVLSDTSLKCGFLNNYEEVLKNKDNHIYLFDEADTILNPLISELNYPDGNEVSIDNISEWFSLIYCLLNKIYNEKSNGFKTILEKFKNDWSYQPHFYIINPKPEFINKIKQWVKSFFINYFEKKNNLINNLLSNLLSDLNVQNLFNDPIQDNEKINILNLLYVFFDIIESVLPTVFSMINRVNFGVHELKITQGESIYVAIPFNYNEDPSLGSKFSNPLLTICLTMVDYILSTKENSIKTLSNDNLNKIFELMIKEYNSIPEIYREKSKIYQAFLSIFNFNPRINIRELTNISMLNDVEIQRLRKNGYLIYLLCKDQCSKLKIDLNRDSISGFDLFMSFNLKNRVGFTGTSNIPKVIDLNKNREIDILTNVDELNKINGALQNFIKILVAKNNSNYDLIEEVISSDNKINTLIDVGGVFVGLDPIGIFEVIKKYVFSQNNKIPEGFQFIYFGELDGESDVKITVDEYGNQQKWSEIISSNIYYYFDQRHTTGTDAKIPNNSIGAAFLNKNSRWRDIVQSVYRMRGFGKSDENPTEIYNINHRIIFVINEQLKELINVTVNNNQIDEKNKLLEWFNILENNSKDNQMALARIQNIKSLSRPGRSRNKFKSVNDFMFFDLNNLKNISSDEIKNIILGNKSWEDQEIKEFIKEININNNDEIKNLINDYEKSNHMLINQLESTSQIQVQVKEQVQSQVINIESEAIKQKPKLELKKLGTTHQFTIEDYFNYSRDTSYYDNIIDECLYVSVNFNIYNNKDRDSSHVIYIDDKLLMIPNTEGFKLIDYLKENESAIKNEYIIFDTKGTVYLTKFNDDSQFKNQLSLIKSYVKLMFGVYFNNYIMMEDYINVMILLKLFKLKEMNNIIELIKLHISKIDNSIIVNYIECLNVYLNQESLIDVNQTIINFFTFDGKYKNEGNNYLQILQKKIMNFEKLI